MASFDQKGQNVGIQYNADTININIGISREQYKTDLFEKEAEIRKLLIDAALTAQDKSILEKELAEVERLRQDEKASYDAHVRDLQERITRLDQLEDQLPDKLIKDAQAALASGDHSKADALFSQLEAQADPHILAAAEVAYQRGKLAEDKIAYGEAFKHYKRAVELSPDDPEYLGEAGSIAGIVADYLKEIEWKEKALALYLTQEGEDSPKVAEMHNGLGLAWGNKGDYDKAISYYEQALTPLEKILGINHPTTKSVASNLAAAKAKTLE